MKMPLATVDTLKSITVATPCSASWEKMRGNERIRFCDQCQQKVYNLSEMAAVDIVRLIREKEDRLCVRLYRRADGTVITADCAVGLRWKLWKSLQKRTAWAASLFAVLFLPACGAGNMVPHSNGNMIPHSNMVPDPTEIQKYRDDRLNDGRKRNEESRPDSESSAPSLTAQ